MKAYLDYNIFCSIENGDLRLEDLINNIDKRIANLPYSHAHIQEIKSIKGKTEEQKLRYIYRRLDTIKNLTNSLYLYFDYKSKNVYWLQEDPLDVLKTISGSSFADEAINRFANLISVDTKAAILKQLGIDKTRLNNYHPSEVIAHLGTKLQGAGISDSFLEAIERAASFHPGRIDFGHHNYMAAVVEILDMLGYWQDKHTETSNTARVWDSAHIFSASFCEYLISDDRRMRNKARVVYDIYGVRTQVLSSKGLP